MIIDFHTHTFPDAIAEKAINVIENKALTPAYRDGTVTSLLKSMADAGVTHSVCLAVATNPLKVPHINDVSIQSTNKNNLIYFGCMHPDFADWKSELKRIADAGLKGIKLHPQYQGVDIDDVRSLRILDYAGQLGLMVVIHAGKEPAYPGEYRASPEKVRYALSQVGPVTMIGAHMGGYQDWDRVADQLGDTGIYIDTGFSLGYIAPMEAKPYSLEKAKLMTEEQFCKLVRDMGAHRVVFGTDSPWRDQKQSVAEISGLPLTDDEKALIFYKNACKLLKIPEES